MICARCGADNPSTADPKACVECGADPRLGDRYRLEALLGQGTHGMTYRARGPDGGLVAVKMVNLGHGLAAERRSTLDREVAVLAAIDHPRIPKMIEHFTVRSGMTRYRCIVQTYVDGPDLAQRVRGRRPSAVDVLGWVAELADVLDWLHRRTPPIIHRDLKPENVLRRKSDGALILIDFGSVRDSIVETLGGTMGMGTAGYMAPEQVIGDVRPQSDVFSLGATAITLLTGKPPHELRERDGRMIWPSAGIPAGAVALIDRMVEPDPDQRPSAAEVRDAARRLVVDPRGGSPRSALPVPRIVAPVVAQADEGAAVQTVTDRAIRDARRGHLGLMLLMLGAVVSTIASPFSAETSAIAGLICAPIALYTAFKSWQAGSKKGTAVAMSAFGLTFALWLAVNLLSINPIEARTVFPFVLVPYLVLAARPAIGGLLELDRRSDPEALTADGATEIVRTLPPATAVRKAKRASLMGGGAMLLAGIASTVDIESFMISAPAAAVMGLWLAWRGRAARMRMPTLMGLSMPAAAFALYLVTQVFGVGYWSNRDAIATGMLIYGVAMALLGLVFVPFSKPSEPSKPSDDEAS